MTTSILRIPMALGDDPRDADPAHILFNTTWGHLENISSPVVEWSVDGQIRAGAAKSFNWHGNELHLDIRDDYRTVDGLPITADDAAFSLKRLIVLSRNTHGFIADFLCGDTELKSVDDKCSGIKVVGNKLILIPQRGGELILRMLTAMDFVMLLRSQVDPATLKVTSFRNTTGPYHIEQGTDGQLIYVANKGHWNYSAQMPQVIQLIPYVPKQAERNPQSRRVFEIFTDNMTDIVINFSSDRPELYSDAAKLVPDASLVPTLDFGRLIASFTARGMRELSSRQRIAIGKAIRDLTRSVIVTEDNINKPVEQFFSSYGDGALSDSQVKQLGEIFAAVPTDTNGKGIRIALPKSMVHLLDRFKDSLQGADCRGDSIDYVHGKADGEPHIFIISTDTGWTEDLGLLSYSVNMGHFFPSDKKAGQEWIREYVEIADREERLARLRDLHFKALSDPWVIPIASQAYYTLVRSPWQYHGPKLFNSGALWHLRHP